MFKNRKHILVLAIILTFAAFLRLWRLSDIPVSLFGDELDVGYHAYSILKTGKDYYGNFLPFHFHSLAEWRTPLYLYSAVPTVSLFGISALGVRLPAAVFGILNILAFYYLIKALREKYLNIKANSLELIAAFVMAISPWHIQYSRAGFEVTLMLLFLLSGLYFFIHGLKENKYLLPSAICFALMPWVYSTAKLFIPFLGAFLLFVYSKELLKVSKKALFGSGALFLLLSIPIIFSILFGGGSQRFGYISVFSDPTIEHEVGTSRDIDLFRESGNSRLFHNKFVVWGAAVTNNYLQAFSTDFLFIKGDLNLRHSINYVGMLYKVEIITLIIGLATFFTLTKNIKIKLLVAFWILGGVIPSAITREGGNHATRLILILPPLMFLVSYGIYYLFSVKNKLLRLGSLSMYFTVLLVLFIHYQHQFWVHNPWNSERWWHYGWEEAIDAVRENEDSFDKVVISTADEPPWIFFAAWYPYPPAEWQDNFPLENKVYLEGFGEVSYINKFYFGSPTASDVYEFGNAIDSETLYLASAKEVGPNLVAEPERTPPDLNLIKSIAYPSGEPAFYLFSKK